MTRTSKPTTLPERFSPGFIRELDQRSSVAIRLTQAFENIVADAGGYETLTHTKLAIIERFVFLEALIQTWEGKIATTTDPVESVVLVGKVVQASNALLGLARTIGLERVNRPAGGDLATYLRGRTA